MLSSGIPFVIWGETALSFVHFVPTELFELEILVPDDLVQAAADHLLREFPGFHVTDNRPPKFVGYPGMKPILPSPIPNSVQLEWTDSANYPEKLAFPIQILIIAQSHVSFDVRDSSSTRSLIPPFDESDSQIRFPTQGAFIDALADCLFEKHGPKAHMWFDMGHSMHFLSYILMYNIRHDFDEDPLPPTRELLPAERKILDGVSPRNKPFVEAYIRDALPGPTDDMVAEWKRLRSVKLP